MAKTDQFDALIIGGSYAGLSAAMALGRSMRNVLVIDSGNPCNKQTPHSHNFLAHDGETPANIAHKAKAQVLQYPTISFHEGLASGQRKLANGFEITTEKGQVFTAKKLLFATGVTDLMPPIPGFAESWGISVLHCPYCHGYEVKNEPIGLLGNGDYGFEFSRMLNNWTKNLALFTNGPSTVTNEQTNKIKSHNIAIIETPITALEHKNGYLKNVVFADETKQKVTALFARPATKQQCELPEQLGCALTDQGLLQVDDFQRTTVHGVFAAGDTTTMFRTVSQAVAAGTKAGALLNKELIEEEF